MNVKIERVEAWGVAMPLAGTFSSAGIAKKATKALVVRLTASDGHVGIISAEPSQNLKSPHTAADLLVAVRERIGPAIVGMNPLNLCQMLERLAALAPEQQGARSAVEMACVDLAARILGVPVHTYLGGEAAPEVQFNGWIGMLPPDEAAADARRWLAAGFRSAKIKVGGGVAADADRVAAVRDAVGSAMALRMDANALYDPATSLELCKAVKKYDMQLFEQPAAKHDIEGLARVRREGGIPIMADESISDHKSLLAVIKADAADYVKFGVEQAGGVFASLHMMATAEAAGIPCVVGHGFGLDPSTMMEIMVAATSRNVLAGLECVGPLKVVDTVTTTRLDISKGSLTLPDCPGLGVELDEAKLEQYRL